MAAVDLNYPLTRYVYRPVSRRLASLVAHTPITPTQLTLVSTLVTFGGGVAFGYRAYVLGVALTLVGQIADCADGDLARISGRTSRAGGFLDSVLDRWTDAALIVGLGLSDLDRFGVAASFALVGAFLTSYTRARAQSLGADCPDGLGTRDIRLLLIMVAALSGYILVGLWLVAASGFVTAVHRLLYGMSALGRLDTLERRKTEAHVDGPLDGSGPAKAEAS